MAFSHTKIRDDDEDYVFERSSGGKKGLSQRRSIQISTTLFLKYLFVICHTRTHTHASSLSLPPLSPCTIIRAHMHTRARTHTDPGDPEMDIFVDYMVATALDQWNERDTLISLLIILWRSLLRASSRYFPEGRGVSSFVPSTTSKLTN